MGETIVSRAKQINKVLEALGISKHSTTGKEIRDAIALELLGEEHPTLKLYSKTKFTASAETGKIKEALFLLENEGLIKNGKLKLEDKSDKK